MNSSYLGGRVDSDVVVTKTSSDKLVANFMMSTRHRDKVDHHKIVAWGDAATIASTLRVGDLVFIEGRLQTRNTGEGEQKKREVEVVAWTIYPIRGRLEMRERAIGE